LHEGPPLAEPLLQAITRGLAWEFSHSERIEGASTLHRFKSEKPVADRTYLRFSVTVTSYGRPETAETAFDSLLEEADPDTGLSYAWDTVLLSDERVVHLWAPCLFSRENFGILEGNLASATIGKSASTSIRCSCGGGCKLSGDSTLPIE
jgi:hypothetical protein